MTNNTAGQYLMPRLRISRITCSLVISVFFYSCTSIPSVPARFYNLNNGEIIKVKLYHFPRDKGEAVAELPHGNTANGNYILASKVTRPIESQRQDADERMITMPDDKAWAEMYGYSSNIESQPVGSGVFINENGVAIRMLLYSVDTRRAYGTGIARDNEGNWYRVHIGRLTEE